LLAVGNDEEAWRYLSSPIDRAPREGTSFEGAAEVLERAGKLEQALGLWRRAFAIDATNPTWLQRQAATELALGHKDAARATVQKILDRRWHVRWDGVTLVGAEREAHDVSALG
jgi:tetratricopeptide (TPR) repeat protein